MGLTDYLVKYNPIVMATDVVTGGAASEAFGVDEPAYQDIVEGYEDISGKTAEEAAAQAGATQADAMREQLAYLKEINKLPQQYREQALTELAGMTGITGDPQAQQAAIDRAKASPLYQEIMGGMEAGEEAIMRQAGATGGFRSGNVKSALYDHAARLRNQALTQAYGQQMQGLRGLAGLETGTGQISQTMGDIGRTEAQAILGAAQARQAGTQNLLNLGLSAAGLFV